MSTPVERVSCKGRSNCFACNLRQTMVCADVSLEDLVAFHVPIDDLVYPPGSALFEMGERAEAVFCIRHGVMKLVRQDAGGNQWIVRVLKKNDVAGLESVFSGVNEHSGIAVSEVHACRIPMAHFKLFIAQHAGLQRRLLETTQQTLREMDAWLSELVNANTPARVRVARLLLRLRVSDGDRIHRFSLKDMGTILGVTPETVSRVISDFLRQGYLMHVGKLASRSHFRGDIAALTRISLEG